MHTRYKDGLENVVFTVKAEGKRRRLRLFYIGNLSKCVDFGEAELLLATKDRVLRRTVLAEVRIG